MVHGAGTFEGADVSQVNKDRGFLAVGLRTDREEADQVDRVLREIGTRDVIRPLPPHGASRREGAAGARETGKAMWNREGMKDMRGETQYEAAAPGAIRRVPQRRT